MALKNMVDPPLKEDKEITPKGYFTLIKQIIKTVKGEDQHGNKPRR